MDIESDLSTPQGAAAYAKAILATLREKPATAPAGTVDLDSIKCGMSKEETMAIASACLRALREG